jgi:hypothetical protein
MVFRKFIHCRSTMQFGFLGVCNMPEVTLRIAVVQG